MEVPPLHLVTDDRVLASDTFRPRAVAAIRAGADRLALHLRGPRTAGRPLYEAARALLPEARRLGATILVNDRVDVALAAGAHGVQLGARGMTVADARALLGAGPLIGVSVHGRDEVLALSGRPDLLLVGTLFPTASHPGREGAGVGLIRELRAFGWPVVGIGGITPERAAAVGAAGGAGVAVLRGIWDEPDPADAVNEYLERWQLPRI